VTGDTGELYIVEFLRTPQFCTIGRIYASWSSVSLLYPSIPCYSQELLIGRTQVCVKLVSFVDCRSISHLFS